MKNFKLILPHIFIIFLMISCGGSENRTSKEGQVKVSGEIKSPPKSMNLAILEKQNPNTGQYEKVEEQKIENGEFIFNIDFQEPDFYKITLAETQEVYFVVGNANDEIEIAIDASNPNTPHEIKGSKDTEYYQKLNQMFADFQMEVQRLEQVYASAGNEKAREKLDNQFKELNVKYIEEIKKVIEEAKPSVVGIYAAHALDFDQDIEYLEKLAKFYQEKLPNSTYTEGLLQRVAKAKPLALGQTAPEIILKNIQGKTIKLSSLKGKIVLVDFWASWCVPCRKENPKVLKIYEKYKNQGFEIYGVSVDRAEEDWKQAVVADGIDWVHVFDVQHQAAENYQIQAIPTTLLLDEEGKILAKNLRGEALEKRVAQALNN